MFSIVDGFFDPDRLILLVGGAGNRSYLADRLSFLQTVNRIDGKATAFDCYDFTCGMPVTDPGALRRQLEKIRSHGSP